MTVIEAIIIAIVEGITEFLPVSSTGHMIITQELLGMKIDDFVKAFTVNIQFGAILSVVVLYWKRFFQSLQFYYKLFVAFIPAAVIGFLAGDFIDSMLESVVVVAVMLVLGGVVLVFVDKWFNKPAADQTVTYPTAFKIGLFQCIAMIPGVSRSAATIIGGMTQKLDRKTAAEFSFFLAVPTMFAAAGYKLMQNYQTITAENIDILLIGNAVAFVVAMIAIKSFISFLTKYGFRVFGYYRILVGLAILIMIALGYDLNIA
ncbi:MULTISPECIES: undecaprenyl-diphosphate phosphatase [Lentimicrobium]|jgi:undecaprenyl-diphosphatase|uniref:Undecaprenyl-diphosphatase n=1 Tax=Lentimicrobium saccharophilum TaxID=1678841 RepID=A0A0S7C543_9BACT|nr:MULTISPECIES: undecaprenyl-diphosphate phosphatase [Lentimicrobium]GAP44131.1 undecaprenyl-diphosphatase UppP [Lentimicrobium saccharophilum]HPF64763.1 undecaprenyl-diphosphate phosphatase [Lentimicrobium sp.]HPJ62483.1 undecaprenyl-diphosphate phosphatase [Lentimicrobium sp.]HPR24966.1 undecaprenyl-diphosphate phosphatase [Lentimicrobium sp.]HRW69302.1 undecaprenyl-diphosphate phosphatase [Lentimicrobium sp.]